jgi:hypothetical protein
MFGLRAATNEEACRDFAIGVAIDQLVQDVEFARWEMCQFGIGR